MHSINSLKQWFLGSHRSTRPKLSAAISQMIHEYISVMATLKFAHFSKIKNKGLLKAAAELL